MRTAALLFSLAAFGMLGWLFYSDMLPLQTIKSGHVANVTVDNLAYREPEIMKEGAAQPTAPAVVSEPEESSSVRAILPLETEWIPLTAENAVNASCVSIGPIYEGRLPQLRTMIEREGLIGKMVIEPIPFSVNYSAYMGPFSSAETARIQQKKLIKRGVDGTAVMEFKRGGYALLIRSFTHGKDAEVWTQAFGQEHSLPNIKITQLRSAAKPQVRVFFSDIDGAQAAALLKRAQKLRFTASVCPVR